MDIFSNLFYSLMTLAFLLFSQQTTVHGGRDSTETNHVKGIIGAIVDYGSRIGKEEKVAMDMAINDTNQRLTLKVENSQREPVQAALAAKYLIEQQEVQAILGPRTWDEASLVAEVGSQSHIPILSFADSTPPWATNRWPFLIQASPSHYNQMKAIAAIVQSWRWRRVIAIYEDVDSAANGFIPHLSNALREVDAEICHLIALPPFDSSSLSEEFERLKREQCRVFVVHASSPLAICLFEKAKKMGMMEKGYVWITTDTITSLFHSFNSSIISSMQGIVGVKRYFPETGSHFQEFYTRFHNKFSSDHPEEKNHDPSVFALQAYDATRAVALAMEEGQQLLEEISLSDFDGLSGKVQFIDRKLAPVHVFQIVNVIGKSYRELGFWSEGLGFSDTIDGRAIYNVSMKSLGQVVWPGGPWSTPRGWTLPTITNPLRIGVPNGSLTNRFVKISYDHATDNYSFSGFSIDVFKATLQFLPYCLPCDFIPFEGTYDSLVQQVQIKKFDAAVGDIAIIARRYEYAEFTHSHTESGLVMVVLVQSQGSNKAWLFMKPFTKAMWVLTASASIYNGFVIWIIERDYCSELKGSALNQVGRLLWLAFATLLSLNGEKLHSNLSRMATIVWLFVALVITQSYTASLTSMLTVQRLEPAVANIETLKSSNAKIGFSRRSFVLNYLVDALHFNRNNIKNFSTTEEYARALKSGEIAAAFLEVPVAKLFVAKYCQSFMTAGPTYKVGGYGYAFPKGSPMLPDINEALLKLFESGALRELENSLTGSEKCVEVELDNKNVSLSPNSFWVLFLFTGGTSTAALAIYYARGRQWTLDNSMLERKNIWMVILILLKHWESQKNRFSKRVSHVESPTNPPSSSGSWTLV